MIAPREHLPLLQLEDGTLATFEREWLKGSIARAAQSAGYRKWWLAEHIGASVIEYFSRRVEDQVVSIERIVGAVREVLEAVGYQDVAGHYDPTAPPLRISLLAIAKHAGAGGELMFYQLLEKDLTSALTARVRNIQVEHLREAVKELVRAKNWRRACDELSYDIVQFAHERVRTLSAARAGDILLQIT